MSGSTKQVKPMDKPANEPPPPPQGPQEGHAVTRHDARFEIIGFRDRNRIAILMTHRSVGGPSSSDAIRTQDLIPVQTEAGDDVPGEWRVATPTEFAAAVDAAAIADAAPADVPSTDKT
jgi:hypothetical protein